MKNNRGITLVALVITIIILAILVGITVGVAIKGGLFEKTRVAAEGYDEEKEKERISPMLAVMVGENPDILYSDTVKEELEEKLGLNNVSIIDRNYYEKLIFIYESENTEYICYVKKDTAEVTVLKKYKTKIIPGPIPNGDEIQKKFEQAKSVDYKLSTLESGGYHNVVYTSNENVMDAYSLGQDWTTGGVKMETEAYCANNVMIYDGTSPYVPVMVRFWREDKNTKINKKDRGLEYFAVTNPTDMNFNTRNDDNSWEFVLEQEYNYDATSSRQCASNTTVTNSFKDVKYNSYVASGRLTYENKPIDIITTLGAFEATSRDNEEEENATYKSFSIGSNYVVDVTEYYNALNEGQELLDSIGETIPTTISTEVYNLSYAIVKAIETKFEYNSEISMDENVKMFAEEIDGNSIDIKEKINELKESQKENISKLTPEIEAIINLAVEVSAKIPTLNINGGYNIVYTSHENVLDAYSGYQEWTNKVDSRSEIYCANNVMIYDGTSPYVPVMVRFWREDDWLNRNKSRGLKYFAVTNPSGMTFSTKNDDNSWEFVSTYEYNYDADSDNQQCSSDTSGNPSFADSTANSRYASGRLTYEGGAINIVDPETGIILKYKDLGSFEATSADQDNANLKSYSVGSNYVVDVTDYYNAISRAQDVLSSDEKIYANVEVAYELAQKINECVKNEYTFDNAEEFSKEIKSATKAINDLADKMK